MWDEDDFYDFIDEIGIDVRDSNKPSQKQVDFLMTLMRNNDLIPEDVCHIAGKLGNYSYVDEWTKSDLIGIIGELVKIDNERQSREARKKEEEKKKQENKCWICGDSDAPYLDVVYNKNLCNYHYSYRKTRDDYKNAVKGASGTSTAEYTVERNGIDKKTGEITKRGVQTKSNGEKGVVNNMFNFDMSKIFGAPVGEIKTSKFKVSMMGVAVTIDGGQSYVAFDLENKQLVDQADFVADAGDMVFALPTTTVEPGDLIMTKDGVLFITEINADGRVFGLNPATQREEIYTPTAHMLFRTKFYVKVISMFSLFMGGDGEFNPMMLMMMGGFGGNNSGGNDFFQMMMMSQMLGGDSNIFGDLGGGDFKSLLPLMMFSGMSGNSGGNNNMMQMLMMTQLMGGDNPFAALTKPKRKSNAGRKPANKPATTTTEEK